MILPRLVLAILALLVAAPSWAVDETIVFSQSANGTRTLRPFEVKAQWEIRWQSADPIAVTVFRADGKENDPLSKLPVASGSQTKGGKGSTYVPQGGHYYLQIMSMGEWTISVVQLP